MEKLSIGNDSYSFRMFYREGKSFDNTDALGERFTFLFVENGSGLARLNDKSVPFIAPCIFCLNETEHIAITESNENRIRAIFIHPCVINCGLDFENVRSLPADASVTLEQDSELLKLFVTRANNYSGRFDLGPGSAKKISSLFTAFQELIGGRNTANWPCRSRSHLLWLLVLIENLYSVGAYSDEKIEGEATDLLNPILLYIYHNYDKKITVEDITGRFYISRTTLASLFRKNIGDTFLTYLNKLRIRMASAILRDTLLPINEIMTRVGFSDAVHFFRTFKKYTGVTPTEYREKYGWM